ncbi:MAG TPA: hypothetical protein VIG85_10615, partial [Comamonas sp.]
MLGKESAAGSGGKSTLGMDWGTATGCVDTAGAAGFVGCAWSRGGRCAEGAAWGVATGWVSTAGTVEVGVALSFFGISTLGAG